MNFSDVKRETKEVLEEHRYVKLAYLFGSQAKGQQSKESDVDIGILLEKGRDFPIKEQTRLAGLLEETLGRQVDLVILNDKHPRFLQQVLKYGKVLYSESEKTRINFETNARSKYLDMKPHIREYNQMVKKRMTT